jgi:hypothetical protein
MFLLAQSVVKAEASSFQLWGAGLFGAILGWYLYYVNRYRKGDVQLGDFATVLGAIGGGAVTALFDAKTDLFGAYGIGLGIGFFGYFILLLVFVLISKARGGNFNLEWFLDGRCKLPDGTQGYPPNATGRGAMEDRNQAHVN